MSAVRELTIQSRATFLADIHLLIAQYCEGCISNVYAYKSFNDPSRFLVDIKLTRHFTGQHLPYAIKVGIYSNERSGKPQALIHWGTMGYYTVDFCKAYLDIVGAATHLTEEINKLYEETDVN